MGVWIRWIVNYLLKAAAVVVAGTAAAMVCHMACAILAPVQTEAFMHSVRYQSLEEWTLKSIFSLFPSVADAFDGLNLLVGKIQLKTINTPLMPLYDVTNGILLAGCSGVLAFVYEKWIARICDVVTGTENRFADWFMSLLIMMISLLLAGFCSLPMQMLFEQAYGISSNEAVRTLAVVGVFAAALGLFVLLLMVFGSNFGWMSALRDAFGKILLSALAAALIYLMVASVQGLQTGGGWMSEWMAVMFIAGCPIVISFLFPYMAIKK